METGNQTGGKSRFRQKLCKQRVEHKNEMVSVLCKVKKFQYLISN